jgi:hypothetical protein
MSASAPPVTNDVCQGPITTLPWPASPNHQSAIDAAIPAMPISSHFISSYMVEIFNFLWLDF